ncbi:hypothetical protein CEXT_519931 [Caerostris extrusa]|uniref:Uncharacterized protein n=1 Tax=Caerostris extrusa TaxID=172846 RepID=A0AAV4X5M3_CAEEX|nr:hypothetical protein CEXT_519931 [Caerostris extrusa]
MQTNARSCSSFTRASPQPTETAELSPAFGKILSAADSSRIFESENKISFRCFEPRFCAKQPLMQTSAGSCSSFTRVSPQPIETAELRPAFGKILSAADSPRNVLARGSFRVLNAYTQLSPTLRESVERSSTL